MEPFEQKVKVADVFSQDETNVDLGAKPFEQAGKSVWIRGGEGLYVRSDVKGFPVQVDFAAKVFDQEKKVADGFSLDEMYDVVGTSERAGSATGREFETEPFEQGVKVAGLLSPDETKDVMEDFATERSEQEVKVAGVFSQD